MEILRDSIVEKLKGKEEPQGIEIADEVNKNLGDIFFKWILGKVGKNKKGNGKDISKKEIINYLKGKGYSNESIAGIVGNIDVESMGSFDYTRKEDLEKTYDELGEGYGLFQFTGGTKKRYYDYLDMSNKKDSMESQVDFMDEMVKGNIKYYNEKDKRMVPVVGFGNVEELQDIFLNETDPGKIALKFGEIFEQPEEGKEKYPERSESALYTFESFNE